MTNEAVEFASCNFKNKKSCILLEEEGDNLFKAMMWVRILENKVAAPLLVTINKFFEDLIVAERI